MGKKSIKKILILATMSAGKSTLINALIGNDFFPSKNEACTTKIMTYTVDNNLKNIKTVTHGERITEYINIGSDRIEILNKDLSIDKIEVFGAVKSTISINKNITFIDTPGVNNSQNESHIEITSKELEKGNFNTIMYILNATQIGIDDDAELLSKLRAYLKQNKRDVLFIINKIDMINPEKEDISQVYKNAIDYIKKVTGINKPKVICSSMYNANLIKKEMNSIKLSRKEKLDLNNFKTDIVELNLDFSEYSNVSLKKEIEVCINDEYYNLIKRTGLVNIEKYLLYR